MNRSHFIHYGDAAFDQFSPFLEQTGPLKDYSIKKAQPRRATFQRNALTRAYKE